MKRIVAGILAHVDAGKTTLSEALLYRTGHIRKLGRVDHGDAFLDTEALEKQRGITIHTHQAAIQFDNMELTLLDTPGHVDFAAETERVLRVLDYAILVVSGTDGIQGHTETLWRLLARYHVPTFIFVNKMDASGADRERILTQLRYRFSDAVHCLPILHGASGGGELSTQNNQENNVALSSEVIAESELEDIATLSEIAMNDYLNTGAITLTQVQQMIAERALFPVFFGSALKLDGVDDLMAGLALYTREPQWPTTFGARIYKVSHDAQHNRLTWMRVTGGTLKAKTVLTNKRDTTGTTSAKAETGTALVSASPTVSPTSLQATSVPTSAVSQPTLSAGNLNNSTDIWQEKADQVRVYNGAKFEIATHVPAGAICAVTGLTHTFPGEGLGIESDAELPTIQPVLTYTVLPADASQIVHSSATEKSSDEYQKLTASNQSNSQKSVHSRHSRQLHSRQHNQR